MTAILMQRGVVGLLGTGSVMLLLLCVGIWS